MRIQLLIWLGLLTCLSACRTASPSLSAHDTAFLQACLTAPGPWPEEEERQRILREIARLPDSRLAELGFFRVRVGDTLRTIAVQHGIPLGQLAVWNNIADPARVKPGDILVVRPEKKPNKSPEPTSTRTP
jgi:hypothetical protein